MKLVIAEKPSVGAAIAAVMGANEKRSGYFEGGGYLVSWCIGHLISLADAATYNEQFRKWKYDDLPIVPQEWQFIVASGKEQQFSILKDLMHRSDVTEIINACDSGREGELIFRFVYEQANCKKPFSRLWISSMEASAIREGFSNLKDGRSYDNLYQSALCRAKADWLIGINATRLFSILYHKTLNVGRVQTPTLAMLVNRDYAISSFKKEKYHVVRLDVAASPRRAGRLSAFAFALRSVLLSALRPSPPSVTTPGRFPRPVFRHLFRRFLRRIPRYFFIWHISPLFCTYALKILTVSTASRTSCTRRIAAPCRRHSHPRATVPARDWAGVAPSTR